MPRLLGVGIPNSTQSVNRPLAILGGTFDPIHDGHLYLARRAVLNFSAEVRLLPNGEPPHRPPPVATWAHRTAMCRIAVRELRHVEVGDEEPPGRARYTVDTLRALRRQEPKRTLLLIVGADAFADIEKWERWRMLFDLAHIVVAARAGTDAPPPAADGDMRRRLVRRAALAAGVGGVYVWRCRPPAAAAANIRAALAAGQTPLALPPALLEYAKKNALYNLIQ